MWQHDSEIAINITRKGSFNDLVTIPGEHMHSTYQIMTTYNDSTQLDSACSESMFYVVDIGRDGRPLHGPRKIPASVDMRAKLAQFRSGFSTHLIYALREIPLAIG